MLYKGSCHCGDVTFEVEGEIETAMDCNCSICARKGALLWFVAHDALRLLTPDDRISTYTFGERTIEHQFCKTCGIHPFGQGVAPSGERMAAINIRCLEGVEPADVAIEHFDGRAL